MKKLILILTLLCSIAFADTHAPEEKKKYDFYWSQVPAVCSTSEEIRRWAKDKGFRPISVSNGRNNGRPDGEIVYIVIYYINENGETFATAQMPGSNEVCVLFRTFDLQLNPEILEKFGGITL